ncbi:hypothetical protein SNE40_020420 [Patella caerulea]|uniref:Noggin n=1 Tax=Patella caerulea TaxID=87958 RepID=A0AAN8GAJ5_PATCE
MWKLFQLLALVINLHSIASSSSQLYFRLLEADDPVSEKDIHHQDGHRPHPSDTLPIKDLIENPNTSYDPKPEDINRKILKHLIGNAYDKHYMSIKTPPERKNITTFTMVRGRPAGPRPKFVKVFKSIKHKNGPTFKLKVGKKERRKFQKYLWNYTYCPVKYVWKDLGIRFWPRWIKEGSCASSKQRSCSIPPGMSCRPSGSTTKTLLRWYCRNRTVENIPTDCEWLAFQYPIITKCSCSC